MNFYENRDYGPHDDADYMDYEDYYDYYYNRDTDYTLRSPLHSQITRKTQSKYFSQPIKQSNVRPISVGRHNKRKSLFYQKETPNFNTFDKSKRKQAETMFTATVAPTKRWNTIILNNPVFALVMPHSTNVPVRDFQMHTSADQERFTTSESTIVTVESSHPINHDHFITVTTPSPSQVWSRTTSSDRTRTTYSLCRTKSYEKPFKSTTETPSVMEPKEPPDHSSMMFTMFEKILEAMKELKNSVDMSNNRGYVEEPQTRTEIIESPKGSEILNQLAEIPQMDMKEEVRPITEMKFSRRLKRPRVKLSNSNRHLFKNKKVYGSSTTTTPFIQIKRTTPVHILPNINKDYIFEEKVQPKMLPSESVRNNKREQSIRRSDIDIEEDYYDYYNN